MNSSSFTTSLTGTVASLHLHPAKAGEPLTDVDFLNLVEGKGIDGNPRYFGRMSRKSGRLSRRQVTLIEREQIAEHAATLGLPIIPSGIVRSNIETTGVNLQLLVGRDVQIGEAILHFYELRTPCSKMDDICKGLRELMQDNRQGVMAEVIRSGKVRVGDPIKPVVPA